MLSILVPVYNFDVRPFITELHRQATESGIVFEIRCYDDMSYFDYRILNQRLAAIHNVVYRELSDNLGRSKIRNKLAEDAKYNNLLFLDCDGECENTRFLENYTPFFDAKGIVCGGRSYSLAPPDNPAFLLHWLYGTQREVIPVKQRSINPYKGFQTNNFLADKETFQNIRLNEHLSGYGHEDTLFGIELQKRKIRVTHIENPLVHIGLEECHVFLEKTRQGIANLADLVKNKMADKSIRLYRAYKLIKALRLQKAFLKKLNEKENEFIANLHSSHPDLKMFDRLKLLWLLRKLER